MLKTLFKNTTVEIVLNESTNEVHIRALKTTKDHQAFASSLRIGVDSKGFDLTSGNVEYIPRSFKGLSGFRLKSKCVE